MLKQTIKSLIRNLGYEIHPVQSAQAELADIPDATLYRPYFSPWLGKGEFRHYYELAAPRTCVSLENCFVLYKLLLQAISVPGDIWECGVYRGGSAAMMAAILRDKSPSKKLYLFDTFEGMPQTDLHKDSHRKGEFSNTTLEAVANYVHCDEVCVFRKGFIPATFAGLESARIAMAHIDVDIYSSYLDCLHFIWPRISVGGFIVFDDYGVSSCPGARAAVDEFFAGEQCVPLCLSTGQALVFKGVS